VAGFTPLDVQWSHPFVGPIRGRSDHSKATATLEGSWQGDCCGLGVRARS
jgi:hypothetical protein